MITNEADQGGQEGGKNGRIFGVGWMPGQENRAVALAGREGLSQGDINAAVVLYLNIAIQSEDGTGGKEGQGEQGGYLGEGHLLFSVQPTTRENCPEGR